MLPEKTSTSEQATSTSLWLELSLAERRWLFELKSGDDRAIVVGSDVNSDVLVVRPGVGSTHFHFERAGDAILLVPGYRAALRVNAVRAVEPLPLPPRATIELLNLSLEAVTHSEKPEHMRVTEPPASPSLLAPREYMENLPDETDPTGFTLAPPSTVMSRPDFDTVEAPRPTFDTQPLPRVALEPDRTPMLTAATASRNSTARPAPIGPQGTVMLPVPNLDEDVAGARPMPKRNSSPTTERLPRPQLDVAAGAREAERTAAPQTATVTRTAELRVPREIGCERPSSAADVTCVEVPVPHRAVAPAPAFDSIAPQSAGHLSAPMTPAVAKRAPLPAAPLAAQRTADFDVSAVASLLVTPPSGTAPAPSRREPTPSTVPVTSTASPGAARPPQLERKPGARVMAYMALLGTQARRRPLAVGTAATLGAALLSLALVGATRFATRPATVAASPRSTATAQPVAASSTAAPLAAAAPSAQVPSVPVPTATEREPAAADVASAASHLLAGRFQEAASAYAQLSARDPSNPTYAGISTMLAERASVRCSSTPKPSGCPEVLP